MLLLDTATVPAEHRVSAFREAFDRASVPCRIEHLGPDDAVQSRMHLWQVGAATLFTSRSSGFRLERSRRHVRMGSSPVVAVAVQTGGVGQFRQFGTDALVPTGDLMVNDLAAAYEFSWEGWGSSCAVHVPQERLGLPAEVLRAAAPRLRASPVHVLVRDHLTGMVSRADELAAGAGATDLGSATVDLVRALLVSAAGRDDLLPRVREETLVTRCQAYARAQLRDPELTPARLASVHNVSPRRLYRAFAEAGLSLEQWIIQQRLDLARAMLASGPRRTIESTARACGFATPSHFARRFRQAYGLTPRAWQQMHAEDDTSR